MRQPVEFEGLGMCFFITTGFRQPKAGEFYLSGAIVQAYKTTHDLTRSYHIAVPTFRAVQKTIWAMGERVGP